MGDIEKRTLQSLDAAERDEIESAMRAKSALFDAAEAGALGTPEQLRAQVLRMLDDPRARRSIDDFHTQWLELERVRTIARDPALFPEFTATLPASMQEESLRFIRSVMLEDKTNFVSLYAANHTFVNQELARVYGLQGVTGPGFTRVQLDPTRRRGLLTQPGILASHSYQRTSSPIHRGVFVVRRVLGQPQADPPPGIDFTLPPLDMSTIRTTRDQVTVKTSARDCAGCHVTINGPGFAFEHYDALGRYRTTENAVPIDATGSILLSDAPTTFTNALGLVDAISQSRQARESYAKNWFRYANQRGTTNDDACDVTTLTNHLTDDSRALRELLVDLAVLPSFTLRPEAP
jgi:hypothetical protein